MKDEKRDRRCEGKTGRTAGYTGRKEDGSHAEVKEDQ